MTQLVIVTLAASKYFRQKNIPVFLQMQNNISIHQVALDTRIYFPPVSLISMIAILTTLRKRNERQRSSQSVTLPSGVSHSLGLQRCNLAT
jgi:hypothetical protein